MEVTETEKIPYNFRNQIDNHGNMLIIKEGEQPKVQSNTTNRALATLQFICRDQHNGIFSYNQNIIATDKRGNSSRIFDSRENEDESFDLKKMLSDRYANAYDKVSQYRLEKYAPNKRCCKYLSIHHHTPHAEEKIFKDLRAIDEEGMNKHIKLAKNQLPPGSRIEAIILHINTRLDMCGSCTYALDWELNHTSGFANGMVETAGFLRISGDNMRFYALVSSRQDYVGIWGPSRRRLPEVIAGLQLPETQEDDGAFDTQLELNINNDRHFFLWAIPPSELFLHKSKKNIVNISTQYPMIQFGCFEPIALDTVLVHISDIIAKSR